MIEKLSALVASIDSPVFVNRLRGMFDRDPAGFMNAMLPLLCNPLSIETKQAVDLAKEIAKNINPTLELQLAQSLRSDTLANDARALRILEILGEISDGSRIAMMLVPFLHHSNVKIRSKTALLVGRFNHNLSAAKSRLSEANPRVRANTIESLWGLQTPEARRLFAGATEDVDNRVVGNAAIALYLSGDLSAINVLNRLLRHANPVFRCTAAWAMGHTEDPRFLENLNEFNRDTDPEAAPHVSAAIARIQGRVARCAPDALHLVITSLQTQGQTQRVDVAVWNAEGRVGQLKPTSFVMSQGGRNIAVDRVSERRETTHSAVSFVLPADPECLGSGATEAIRQYVQHKQGGRRYGLLRYHPDAPHGPGSPQPTSLVPDANAILEQAREKANPGQTCGDSFKAARDLVSAMATFRGRKCLVLIGPTPSREFPWADLVVPAQEAEVAITALFVGPQPNESLHNLCHATGGGCLCVSAPADLPSIAARSAARMIDTYTIEYPAPPANGPISVKVYTEQAWASDFTL